MVRVRTRNHAKSVKGHLLVLQSLQSAVFRFELCPLFLSWFVAAGIIGFVLVDALDVSAPLVVLLGAVLGVLGWATNMH